MTLTEFLLARIAEDEAAAQRSKADSAMNPDLRIPHGWVEGVAARVLAECAAKRRIVEYRISEGFADDGMVTALRSLAAVYADHPDYDEAWRI